MVGHFSGSLSFGCLYSIMTMAITKCLLCFIQIISFNASNNYMTGGLYPYFIDGKTEVSRLNA